MGNQAESQRRLRVVSWNIEKGKRWSLIEKCIQEDAIRSADVLCLNEVDEGMARSGNRRIAFEIADRLGMTAVFGAAFKELTKGIGDEKSTEGENTTALQGNAILSRMAILESRNMPLPMCHDPSSSEERRIGGRQGLVVRLDCGNGAALTVANTHLEVFTTMACRARQMRALVGELGQGPAIIAGDFNTNTFERGSAIRVFRSLVWLMGRTVEDRVMSPWVHEPLFDVLKRAGFQWEPFNDRLSTCSVDLASLEDKRYVPAFLRDRILRRLQSLPLRLDFIACRGLHAASHGRTITDLPFRPSDHLPITCDILLGM